MSVANVYMTEFSDEAALKELSEHYLKHEKTAYPSYAAELLVPFGMAAQCEQLLELSTRPKQPSNSQRSLAKCSAWSWQVLVKEGSGL